MKHYNASNYTQDSSLGYWISVSNNALRKRMDVELSDCDLTAAQWQVLRVLSIHGQRKAAELAEALNQDPGAITRMVDRLEAKGLVQRLRSTTDRRVVEIELTPHGLSLAPQIADVGVRVLNYSLQDFSKAELAQLLSLLKKLNQAPSEVA